MGATEGSYIARDYEGGRVGVSRSLRSETDERLIELATAAADDRDRLQQIGEEADRRTSHGARKVLQFVALRLQELQEEGEAGHPTPGDPNAGREGGVRTTRPWTRAHQGRAYRPDAHDEPLYRQLERMRSRLLDLSAANALLNYRFPEKSSLQLVDEIPSQIFSRLLEGKRMKFAPMRPVVPAPGTRAVGTRRGDGPDLFSSEGIRQSAPPPEPPPTYSGPRRGPKQAEAKVLHAARAHGINASYELHAVSASASTRHRDDRLQTLLWATELEQRLRKLHREAQLSIQETGANKLHLMLGFVEWRDTAAPRVGSSTPPAPETGIGGGDVRYAPLVLMPVTLERLTLDEETRTFGYGIRHSGEEWSVNITLVEKCKQEFGLELPPLDASVEDLETYFAMVTKSLQHAPDGWRLRRYATLGLVSFGKILLWRDLDPNNWPATRDPLKHPVVRPLLDPAPPERDVNDPPETTPDDYAIDDVASSGAPVPPLVTDADSSQHSVLIDVARGQNLVVQGPPGTGKSQTITNIIGAALLQGKRVLFVAEKRAALEVVQKRLEDFGLGAFCLGLHSHTSQKRAVIEDFDARIQLRTRRLGHPSTNGAERAQSAREVLNAHARRMAHPVGALKMPAFDVLWRSRRRMDELPPSIAARMRRVMFPDAVRVTAQTLDELSTHARDLALAAEALPAEGSLSDHPWAGITRPDLTFQSEDALREAVREWRAAVHALFVADVALRDATGSSRAVSVRQARELSKRIAPLQREWHFQPHQPGLMHHEGLAPSVERALKAVAEARAAWSRVWGSWRIRPPLGPELERHEQVLVAATQYYGARADLASIAAIGRLIQDALEKLRTAISARETMLAALMPTEPTSLSPLAATAERLFQLGASVESVSDAALQLRSGATADPGAATIAARLRNEAQQIQADEATFAVSFDPVLRPDRATLVATLHGLVGAPRLLPWLLSGDYRRAQRTYRVMSGGRTADREGMQREVRALVAHVDRVARFSADPDMARLFGSLAAGTASPLAELEALLAWRQRMLGFARGLGEDGAELERLAWEAAITSWREAIGRLRVASDRWAATMSFADALRAALGALQIPTDRLLTSTLADLEQLLATADSITQEVLSIAATAEAREETTLEQLRSNARALTEARAADRAVGEYAQVFSRLGVRPAGGETNVVSLESALAFLSALKEAALDGATSEWLLTDASPARLATLVAHARELARCTAACDAPARMVEGLGGLRMPAWQPGFEHVDEIPVDLLAQRLARADAHGADLHAWATYQRVRQRLTRAKLEEWLDVIEAERVAPDKFVIALECALFCSLAAQLLRDMPALDQFNGDAHAARRRDFARADAEEIQANRLRIAQRQLSQPPVTGVESNRVSELTDEALIRHEAGKQRRHIALRDLFTRAAGAIQSLKPCILMGPLAVAQYLPPGSFDFDLVVMDEASQMRPEDALGAMLRGRQVVVVGDPRQLGPTSFFDRTVSDDEGFASEDEEEDEETVSDSQARDGEGAAGSAASRPPRPAAKSSAGVLDDAESILTAAAHRFPMRLLRWHYRSRHPKLITFSNQAFYHNRLIIFPSAEREALDLGVFYHHVAGAVFADRMNRLEADAVVAAVRAHAREHPTESLLVATLNAPQSDLISELLEEAEKDDDALRAFRAHFEESIEPLDVKNLENVQGDERDRILVSITHGPDSAGQLHQRFGPILKVGGERRLNVLFTRAKRRLDVFCSFEPTALRVTHKSSPGLTILRDYLVYACNERWAIGLAGEREPDSDFEIAVAQHLEALGLIVHPQVEVHGYRIDLGVVHPEVPGRYVLGVECDGATYHSAKSARDRDRLRQQVLEGLGWTIARIWSTDWFRDPQREAERIAAMVHGQLERKT